MPSEKKVKQIAIIGLGLIGGSLALSLKQCGYKVIGITKSLKTVKLAKRKKAIDEGYVKLSSKSLENVDVIFIATPLHLIKNYIKQIIDLKLKKEIIITDVGSTKLEICNFAKSQISFHHFIGGHPMAGIEHSGFSAAQKNLFKGAVWVLTPVNHSKKSKQALQVLSKVISEINAKPILTTADKHDKAVALISHMPILIAIGLCQLVQNVKDPEIKKLAMTLAASGFRDTTRIAIGNPEMSQSILKSNFPQLSKLLRDYSRELNNTLELLNKNPKKLLTELSKVSCWRKLLYDKAI